MTPMGITSENVAAAFSISRERQDSFAADSHAKADRAQKAGKYDYEIVPPGETDNGVRPDTSRIPR